MTTPTLEIKIPLGILWNTLAGIDASEDLFHFPENLLGFEINLKICLVLK
jgi:hypothetical protein